MPLPQSLSRAPELNDYQSEYKHVLTSSKLQRLLTCRILAHQTPPLVTFQEAQDYQSLQRANPSPLSNHDKYELLREHCKLENLVETEQNTQSFQSCR